jgi:hypothetical protein
VQSFFTFIHSFHSFTFLHILTRCTLAK